MQCGEADGARCCTSLWLNVGQVVALFACFGFLLGLGLWGSAVMADDVQYAKAVSNRLNTTGRAIDMEVPMKDGDRALGDIPVRINPADSVLINKPALSQNLTPILDTGSRQRLKAIPGNGPFVSLSVLKSAGFDIRFDPTLQELNFHAAVEQRASEDISFSGIRRSPVSTTLAAPARVS